MFFKFNEKNWAIDATTENEESFGRLINHSKSLANLRPKVFVIGGKPKVMLIATKEVQKGQQLFYDYNDKRKQAQLDFPWLMK